MYFMHSFTHIINVSTKFWNKHHAISVNKYSVETTSHLHNQCVFIQVSATRGLWEMGYKYYFQTRAMYIGWRNWNDSYKDKTTMCFAVFEAHCSETPLMSLFHRVLLNNVLIPVTAPFPNDSMWSPIENGLMWYNQVYKNLKWCSMRILKTDSELWTQTS